MIWWTSHPGRALAERNDVARLEQRADWLQNVEWRVVDLALLVDFDIVEGGSRWSLTMRYPDFFPSIPPLVFNAGGTLISGHQYGAAGELCLEYRPDNWQQSCTGAMMIESAHRLLVGESPALDGPGVPSAHRVSEGQRLRVTHLRVVIPREALLLLQDLDNEESLPFEIEEHPYGDTTIANMTKIGVDGSLLWHQAKPVSTSTNYQGTAIRVPRGLKVPGPVNAETLMATLTAVRIYDEHKAWPPSMYLLVDDTTAWLVMVCLKSDGGFYEFSYATYIVEADQQRLPALNEPLADKRIALIGCGSLGSKAAAMLVRSGARKLELFDDDILSPGNLVRNELDWRGVGVHKTRALRARLLEIAPDAKVTVQLVKLGGQESSAWTATALETLSNCDLIIDATADASVFGLAAAAARFRKRPMVWAEVFGGGIGGIVARSRPNHDPSPDIARQQILEWCGIQGVMPEISANPIDYGVSREDHPARHPRHRRRARHGRRAQERHPRIRRVRVGAGAISRARFSRARDIS